jgi:hypothetical protein
MNQGVVIIGEIEELNKLRAGEALASEAECIGI